MKYALLPAVASCALALATLTLAGCAADPQTNAEAAPQKEERCVTLGSNIPSRRCASETTTISPGSVDPTVKTLPAAGGPR